jgi:hypothetical protein
MKCPFDVTPIMSQNSTILPHTITRAQHWPSACWAKCSQPLSPIDKYPPRKWKINKKVHV